MSMKFRGQMMACGKQLTHKLRYASIGRHRTKSLRPLLATNITGNKQSLDGGHQYGEVIARLL